jgi:hypothetical protein
MYKAILASVFALFLAFSVSGCSKSESEECTLCKDLCELSTDADACVKGCEESSACQ